MRMFQKVKDGGPESTVDAYVLIEIKSLFSIMLLKFNKGGRVNYHTHAFNALTVFLAGSAEEQYPYQKPEQYKKFRLKKTPRTLLHRVLARKTSWALTIRGPWCDKWYEFNKKKNEHTVLTHGRKVLYKYKSQL